MTAVSALAQNVDGAEIFSGSDDGSIIYWNKEEGTIEKRMIGAHPSEVVALALHPNGNLLASADRRNLRYGISSDFFCTRVSRTFWKKSVYLDLINWRSIIIGCNRWNRHRLDWDKEEMGFRLETGKPVNDLTCIQTDKL